MSKLATMLKREQDTLTTIVKTLSPAAYIEYDRQVEKIKLLMEAMQS